MIGLDSNILVRYLTQDDPIQSPKAADVIERRLTEENPGFVSIVAMIETAFLTYRQRSQAFGHAKLGWCRSPRVPVNEASAHEFARPNKYQ